MKKGFWYIFFFFFLLFFFFGKDIVYSLWVKTDWNLEKNIVLDSEYERLKKEYTLLLEKTNLEVPFLEEGIVSKVVVHDPYIFFDKITILKGKNDGIELGDAVLNEMGLIGKVSLVFDNYSEVELITSGATYSVRIQNSYGILKQKDGKLQVEDITSKEEIKKEEIIYTSSFTDIPGDIPIGKVVEVNSSSISQTLVIEPLVDFQNLNYVWIRKRVIYE